MADATPSSSDDEPPPELLDDAADAAVSADERFESALPSVPPTESTPARVASDVPAPSVAAAASRIAPKTHQLLDELFKAKITAVKRIARDQLR